MDRQACQCAGSAERDHCMTRRRPAGMSPTGHDWSNARTRSRTMRPSSAALWGWVHEWAGMPLPQAVLNRATT